MTSQQLYDDHKAKLAENDKALDQIHEGVVRIKHVAINMNDELDLQQKLLEDVDDSMDRVQDRLKNNTKMVQEVGKKAKSGPGFWLIILLLIVIVM